MFWKLETFKKNEYYKMFVNQIQNERTLIRLMGVRDTMHINASYDEVVKLILKTLLKCITNINLNKNNTI